MPPDAVRSTEPPEQNVVGPLGEIDAIGNGFTVTIVLAMLLQPLALVASTVFVPLDVTVMAAVVAPFDHR